MYFFLGRNWLITIHSSQINLKQIAERLLNVKNETIKQTRIDALYYNMLAEIVTRYEQLLTGLELSVNEYQRRSFVRPLPAIFESIDTLSRQAIMLPRQFWYVRNIINFLLHTEKDKDDVKYVEMVYDDISQLIDFVESYESTINSIRELYVAKVSLQINETMRVLTRLFNCNSNHGMYCNRFCSVFCQKTLDSTWKREFEVSTNSSIRQIT